jgi:predicted enzyme related to lactoylglutathione lyase
MWADGINGVFHHLIAKASFVLASPDIPEVQEDFSASRKWQFPMISIKESTFTEDMGYQNGEHYHPGVSTFRKDNEGDIYLIAQAPFGPGDDFCLTWPLFDLLPSGSNDIVAKQNLNSQSLFQLTNNIAVGVTDYPNAVEFYENILGMKKEQTLENETKFSMGGTNFFIEENSENNTFFEFAVEDFETAKNLLLENNCVIMKKFTEKSVKIADPYGLNFHLFEIAK